MKLIANLAEIDRQTVQQTGITASTLMESAGELVATMLQHHCHARQAGVFLCGPGNNGGDGFVCARKLHQAGYSKLTVIYTGGNYKNEALRNFEQLMTLPLTVVNARIQPEIALSHIRQAEFVIDALFGSGLARAIGGLEGELIEAVNARRSAWEKPSVFVLAVDLPSGIDGGNGQILGQAMTADATVTFAAAKPGLYLYPGKAHAGKVTIADIGIPQRLIDEEDSSDRLITTALAQTWLPPRLPDSHKYDYGHVLVIAGSLSMPGAAVLCAEAAMKTGAGLVTLATPASVLSQLPIQPEIMRLPLPDTEHLGSTSIPVLKARIEAGKLHAIVIGPGLGSAPETASAIIELLEYFKASGLPVVADADALNALSAQSSPLTLTEQFILTPHVGECGRLLKKDTGLLSQNLLQAAQQTQETYQANIILKSATTVIATPAIPEANTNSLRWISPTGNPGMATAGSGDVLSGITGALAGQRFARMLPIWQAASLGVYLHGLAGDAAATALTPYAMQASDIIRHLPNAFKALFSSAEIEKGQTALASILRTDRL